MQQKTITVMFLKATNLHHHLRHHPLSYRSIWIKDCCLVKWYFPLNSPPQKHRDTVFKQFKTFLEDSCPRLTGNNILSRWVKYATYWWHGVAVWAYGKSITYSFHNARVIEHEKCEVKPYCLRSSISLAVSPAISLMERRMSSLSLGSSHRSAMRLASARSALMFSSPSGPPWGSASHA